MQTKNKYTAVCDRVWERKGISCTQALFTFHPGVHNEKNSVLALSGSAVSVQISAMKEQETSEL